VKFFKFYVKIAFNLSYAKKSPFFIDKNESVHMEPHLKPKSMLISDCEHSENRKKTLTIYTRQFSKSNDAVWKRWVRAPIIPNFMKFTSFDQKL